METQKKPFYKILYVQVLFAIACGVLLGIYLPADAVAMKPLGDGFIKLIKMIIAPVIFCTVVSGIAEGGGRGRGSSVNTGKDVEHVLVTAGTGVPTSALVLRRD
jgi:Na+/H+-dicarboxylate symporter